MTKYLTEQITTSSRMTQAYLAAISKEAKNGKVIKFCVLHDDSKSLDEKINTLNDKWGPGTKPHKIEIAKLVSNPKEMMKKLQKHFSNKKMHYLEDQYFRVSTEEVKSLFGFMAGELWNTNEEKKEEPPKGCRDMRRCFYNGQEIRHVEPVTNDEWIGTYDSGKIKIVHESGEYTALSGFTKAHYKAVRPDRKTSESNGWEECKCKVDGEWISTFNLPCLE